MAGESDIFRRARHTLSSADRADKCAELSTHTSPKEVGKSAGLDTLLPGRYSQPYGDSGQNYQQEG